MSRSVRRAAGALVASALVGAAAAACSGEPTTTPTSAATSSPTPDAAPLQRALLTVTDLPLGFQEQDAAPEATALGCAGVDQVYLASGDTARAAVSFGHSLSPAFVNETISSRPDGGAAQALTAFSRAARECASFTGPDGTKYRVTGLELPPYGDGSAAVRVSSALAEGRPVDLVAVRVGDTLVAIATAGAGKEEAQLTRTVVDRALAKLARTS